MKRVKTEQLKQIGLYLICCLTYVSAFCGEVIPALSEKVDSIHSAGHPFRHHVISLNIADYILQKYNVAYEYFPTNEKWRIRVPVFVDVKDQNYGLAVSAYSNWRISKHVTHLIGGSLQAEYIGSFYQDFYLKFRPRGYAIAPAFATGLVFTAADRFVFGIDAAIGPGMVFRDNRFKGVYLDVRLGLSVGIKF